MTTPYYQDDSVTLYHGDCLEIDAWLEADVLVTDPPYGISYQSGHRTLTPKAERIAGDHTPEARDTALEAWSGRPAIVFGTWRVPAPSGERQRIVWWKRKSGFMGDVSIPWGTTHEEIYVLGSPWKIPDGVRRTQSVIATDAGMGGTDGVVARHGHPTAKPVGLMEQLILRCPPGVVSDPFAGSGSTLVAARNVGRRAIGVELDERYCEIAARRLAQDVLDFGEGA